MADNSFYKKQEERVYSNPDTGLFDRSRKKSSRPKADLFEILVAIKLREKLKLKKENLEIELTKIKEHINKNNYKDENLRLKEQEDRAELVVDFLLKKITEISKKKGQIIKIDWVGRKWQKEGSISDIDIAFKDDFLIGISVKSTRSGFGTQRNIGKATLILYLNLDIDKELEKMTYDIKKELFQQNNIQLKKLSSASLSEIKEAKYNFSIIQNIGKKHGIKVQNKAVNQSVEQFNKLTSDRKKKFVSYIFGLEKKQIINVISVGENIFYCENNDLKNLIIGNFIALKSNSNRGFNILIGEKKLLRIQVNFTNGMGLSPFCERAFLTKETKEYYKKVNS